MRHYLWLQYSLRIGVITPETLIAVLVTVAVLIGLHFQTFP